jgi:hypothetical protein
MKLSIQTVDPMIFLRPKKQIKVSGRFPDEALPLDQLEKSPSDQPSAWWLSLPL